jgi:glycosyltransferase involved in cell wall biosynthesis
MKLLVIRGDLQSHSGYSAAARDYCDLLRTHFDRQIGVDIHYSSDRPFEQFPYPIVPETEAQQLVAAADFALVLSFTTPSYYCTYPNAINVGLTFWETDRLPSQRAEPASWVDHANRMDALWAPCTHTRTVFEEAGVTVPIRVIPWPIRTPTAQPDGLPDGEVYDLDRQAWYVAPLVGLARFHEPRFRWSRWLTRQGGPRAAARVLSVLRSSPQAILAPREHALLCVAQDVPRKGLLLFLSEWMEFKRRAPDSPWALILKSTPIDPRTSQFEFVARFWEHVQALKQQLGVRQAGVYLWAGDLGTEEYARLLVNTFGQVAPSLGEGFCGPAALALVLGKPLVAPRHTAFADYIDKDYPYCFATRPVHVSFAHDPLRVYDPASVWHVAEPFALTKALTRMTADPPERRAEVCAEAAARLADWCSPGRVGEVLAEELRHLSAGRTRRVA